MKTVGSYMKNLDYDQLVDVMLSETDESVTEYLLVESEHDEVIANLGGDTTLMNYLMLFEEYLDNLDVYLFDGWEDAQVVQPPTVEKFWATFTLLVGPKADLDGARRVKDAMQQGDVKVKKLQEGYAVKFMILRRDLDKMEEDTDAKITRLAKDDEDIVR